MIHINREEVKFESFPNGETKIDGTQIDNLCDAFNNEVIFKYHNDGDLIKLMFVKKHMDILKEKSHLIVYYMPYSRMDRVEDGSVFTLKYVSEFINSLGFNDVIILEPHSDVTPALINNSHACNITKTLTQRAMKTTHFVKERDYIFFPDSGASKRYAKDYKDCKILVGHKERDFETGYITKYNIMGDIKENEDFNVIMVDDLCSKGTTFKLASESLKKKGAKRITLVVAHCEDTIYQGDLLETDKYVNNIYTTNTITNVPLNGKLTIYDLLDNYNL